MATDAPIVTSSLSRGWQTARRLIRRVSDARVFGRLGLAIAAALLVYFLLDLADLPWWFRAPLLLVSIYSAMNPQAVMTAVAGVVGLGLALPAMLGLAPIGTAHLIDSPVTGVRVGEAIVIAFLLGWVVRVISRREAVLALRDSRAAPLMLFGVMTTCSLVVTGVAARLQAEPDVAYLSSLTSLLVSGLRTVAWPMPWSRPTAAGVLEGLLLATAAIQLSRTSAGLPERLLRAVAIGASLAGLLSCAQFAMNLANSLAGHGGSLARLSVHVSDMNAAGSHFLLAGLVIVGIIAVARGRERQAWKPALALVGAGLWLSGSRSAFLVGAAVAGVIGGRAIITRPKWRRLGAAFLLLAVFVALSPVTLLPGMPSNEASRSALYRWYFLQTSFDMWVSAPVFGVGIGYYWLKSGNFMPPELHQVYASENAHNNFAQFGAELGLVGLLVIAWLLVAATVRFRAGLQTAGRQPVLVWSGAGLVAFFATCLTGHPLLVQPVAAVTWITLGAVVALADRTAVPARGLPEAREESTRGTVLTRLVAVGLPIAVCLVIASVPFRAEALRHDTDLTHVKYGFIGRFFESGTREAYWLAGPDASFFVKADDAFARVWIGGSEFEQPVEVEIRVNGQPVRMTPVQKYAWQEYKMLLPMPRKSVPFVRIDLKVTNAAGSPPPAAVPPEALARPRVRVSGMEGVPKRRSP